MTAPPPPFVAAAVQMDCDVGDVAANLERAHLLVREAAAAGARLTVLPELFATGYELGSRHRHYAEPVPGPLIEVLREWAEECDTLLITAAIELDATGALFDSAVVVSAEGLLGTQRKLHLWGREGHVLAPATHVAPVRTDRGSIGPVVGYDGGFPEVSRLHALRGAEILVMPAAVRAEQLHAWDLQTRSRALENGCVVIAAARTGGDGPDRVYGGHSRIVDADGQVLAERTTGEGIVTAEIRLHEAYAARRRIPYLRDARLDLIHDDLPHEARERNDLEVLP